MCAMTMGKAIENAIKAELAGARFYRELAGITTDEEAAAFFIEMAAEELDHARHLDARRQPGHVDLDVEQLVGLDEPEATAPPPSSAEDIPLLDAIDIAIEAEEDAMTAYTLLAAETVGEISEFFTGVAQTEERHLHILETLRNRLLENA